MSKIYNDKISTDLQNKTNARFNINGDRICDTFGCRKHTKLTFFGDGACYCKKHETTKPISAGAHFYRRDDNVRNHNRFLATHDSTGKKICDAFGCCRKDNLRHAFGGQFCQEHLKLLQTIRQRKSNDNTLEEEIAWRLEEIRFRKTFEQGHLHYFIKLEHMMEKKEHRINNKTPHSNCSARVCE